jgi:hypothetical protein
MNYSFGLMIAIFVFEVLSIGIGYGLLMLISGIQVAPWLTKFINRHDGKILLVLILGYNLWKSIFITKYLLNWYLEI